MDGPAVRNPRRGGVLEEAARRGRLFGPGNATHGYAAFVGFFDCPRHGSLFCSMLSITRTR